VPSSTKEYQEVMGRSLQTLKTVKICEDLWSAKQGTDLGHAVMLGLKILKILKD
jgi:hypothetical protein